MTDAPTAPVDASIDADDPALQAAVLEIEDHVAQAGWDRPARLFALVETAALITAQPELAASLGLAAGPGSLTPVEQEDLPPGRELETVLPGIVWPAEVAGCAATVERLVLPPEADAEVPADREAAVAFAQEHPQRQEVRIVAAATRGGATYCALRLRGRDADASAPSVMGGRDLVPELLELLLATLTDDTLTDDTLTHDDLTDKTEEAE